MRQNFTLTVKICMGICLSDFILHYLPFQLIVEVRTTIDCTLITRYTFNPFGPSFEQTA